MGLTFKGYGRGKLLLFGEHAAVMGYPAVGASLDRGIGIELEVEAEASRWVLEGFDEAEGDIARAVMKRIDQSVAELPRGGRIRVTSDLPEGRGFGSSAALCVALAEASLAASGVPEAVAHRALVWSIAHHAEGYFHGTPSGIDTGLAALGGIISFTPKPPELPEWRRIPSGPLSLLVGSLPRRGLAKELIASIRERATDKASEEGRLIAELGALSQLAEVSLASREFTRRELAEEIGQLATRAESRLARLGLVDPAVAKLIAAGEGAGSPGGKMSGAGGGGAFWLVYSEAEGAGEGRAALEAKAAELGVAETLTLEYLELRGSA